MRVRRLAILLFLIISSVAYSQEPPYSEDNHWKDVCQKALAEPVVTPSLPGSSAQELAKCDETALYYGFTDKPDYSAALECGWYERAHQGNRSQHVLRGGSAH